MARRRKNSAPPEAAEPAAVDAPGAPAGDDVPARDPALIPRAMDSSPWPEWRPEPAAPAEAPASEPVEPAVARFTLDDLRRIEAEHATSGRPAPVAAAGPYRPDESAPLLDVVDAPAAPAPIDDEAARRAEERRLLDEAERRARAADDARREDDLRRRASLERLGIDPPRGGRARKVWSVIVLVLVIATVVAEALPLLLR